MSKRALQVVTGIVGGLTVALGSVQLAFGSASPMYAAASLPEFPILDSNLRFFGGLGIGIGLVFLWIVPTIEQQATLFRVGWLCAFIGGVGRLVSVAAVGAPSSLLVAFTVLEVAGAPLFVYWQSRVAVQARTA